MLYQPVCPLFRRWLAALLALLIGLGPLATPAYAALTPLADEPLNIKNQAKPNIVLTVDDSTSMLYDFLPDYVVSRYCRDGRGAMNAPCGYGGSPANAGSGGQYVSPQYIWEQPKAPFPMYATGANAVPSSFSPQLFSDSGPGAGCNLTGSPPSCTGGIDPGALPGIATYAISSGSPQAGLPYEYWQLWPAPVHSSALNHMYYNPRLTYDPPVYSDGKTYPQMDAADTSNWTKVRADPFTTPDPLDCSSEPCVDLTAKVIVGQWCNSDWTQGNDDSGVPFVTNPGHCRVNGLIAAASAGAPAAIGDYMYPWAPAGITPNDVTSKVDTSVIKISPPTNATINAAWSGAKDAKYFYENENVLWCDITSPDWPQTGPTVPQTCSNKTTQQTCGGIPTAVCGGAVNGTCGGGVAAGTCSATTTGTCAGYVATGVCGGAAATGVCGGAAANGKCTGYAANGNCSGYIAGACTAAATGNCSGFIAGNCNGFSAGACGGGIAAACANPPTCSGAAVATCTGNTKEACVAGTAASCGGAAAQTCKNGTPVACNAVAQTCNGGGAQTCANIVEIKPDPSTCTSAWTPAGCNLAPDPEGICIYKTTCPPSTFAGKCSIQTSKVCTQNSDCPFVNGTCSIDSKSCAINSDCNLKRCQATTTDCTSNPAICGNVAGSGKCSLSNAACTKDTDCPSQGTCNYQNNAGVNNGACSASTDCKAFPNHCATTVATTCATVGANSASCPQVPNSGACNFQNTAGTANGPCNTAANCKAKPNTCNAPAGLACNSASDCTKGTCSYQTTGGVANGPCLVVGDCKAKSNTCTNAGATFGTVCATAAACTDNGKCNAGDPAKNNAACTLATDCQKTGACTTGNVGAACTANGANAQCALAVGKCTAGLPAKINTACTLATDCQKPGSCTTGNVGAVCTTTSSTDVACAKPGACSTGNVGAACSTTSTTDPACAKTGACTTGNVGFACTTTGAAANADAACKKNGACTTGSVGTICSTTGAAANADPACVKAGACTSGNVGAACTANGANVQCALTTGVCSNKAAACTIANQATACAAVAGNCTSGKPNTTTCSVNSDCNTGNTCSNSGSNGLSCTTAANCTVGPGGKCSKDLSACTKDSDCTAKVGSCSLTGVSCLADSECPNQPGPMSPVGARCDTKGVSGNNLTTLLADANGSAGKACRRNNHAYADGTTASQTNYPSGKFTTPVAGEITAGQGCHATDHYASIPRHYWKTEVEWCDKAVSTDGDKWVGYGTPSGGSCQSFKDASHVYPRFYQFGAVAGTDNYTKAAFARVDLVSPTSYTHTWVDSAGTTQTVTRTYAQEMTNYANWFAYYRTRITAVKTVTSLTFLGKSGNTFNLDDTFRVGFHTLSNLKPSSAGKFDPAAFVDVADFDATQKAAWYAQLLAITIPLGLETPTLNAMSRIGEYFSPGGSSELSGATDPIILSCQKNWHMLFTDGFTNQGSLPTSTVGDQDNKVPTTGPMGQLPVNGLTPVTITGLTPGSAWPPPFVEDLVDPNATASDAASDYSMNYWVTDLRPSMPMNVATSNKDPAPWPHLNFAAMSLGTQGILPSGNQSVVEAQLTAGTLQWPKPQPTVYKPDQSGVDDLWHAAMNGRGRFVNAQSADELKLGMGQILQDVINQAGARAGVGFQSADISGANNFVYRVRFEPGWGASVSKVQINLTTGAEVAIAWEASAQLTTQLAIVNAGDTPWFTNRKVVTVDESGNAVPFLWASIGANELDSLSPGNTARAKLVLEFLRGNRANEGTSTGQFRVRVGGLLGDIVDSQATYVGAPRAPYLDVNDPGYSTNFKNAAPFSTRPARVYVGANDGMLHAFDDATGNEAWAFVPSELFRADKTGLGALSYQDGALPPFQHHFYVDATPRITDVNFGGGSSDWHTILVGGLGKGGRSYYALDISNPASITDETTAAQKVLWQFTDTDMGYSYGRPIIAKTHAFGGKWLVIVAAGYNNPSGDGKIFFLDAKTGKPVRNPLSTGAGTATNPSGLAQIAAYEKDYRNQIAEQIYGGDLLGNFWRFDISDPDDSKWKAPDLIANLTDPNGKPQAVTTPPQIEIDIASGVDRWVFVGTGRLLDDLDLTTTSIADQVQTFYAIRDGNAALPLTPWPATLAPRTDMDAITVANGVTGLTNKPDKGWYDDLPVGQRIVVPVQAALSLVAYVGTSPQTDPCLTGQPATVYAREFSRGNSLLLDDTGTAVESIFAAEGGVGVELVAFPDNSAGATGGYPDLRIAITAGTTGKVTFYKPKAPAFAQQHRMSWRLLGQ